MDNTEFTRLATLQAPDMEYMRAPFVAAIWEHMKPYLGCTTGDCPHHDEKECEKAVQAKAREMVEEYLKGPAPTPSETLTAPVDWTDPGHRLTEAELDEVEKAYVESWRERRTDHGATRHGLECAVRAFLAYNRAPTEAPGTATPPTQVPEWWPECPYPESVFPMTTKEIKSIIPEDKITGVSGYYGRLFWNIAAKSIFDSWKFNRDFGEAKGTEPPARPLESVQSRRAKLAMSIVNYTCENTGVSVKVRQQQNDRLFAWAENQLEEYAAFRADLAAKPSNPLTPKGGEA